MQQKPSINRAVHYHAVMGTKPDGSLNVITLPATITKVHDDYRVDLFVMDSSDNVFGPDAFRKLSCVPWATSYGWANGWSWPPFVKPEATTSAPIIVIDPPITPAADAPKDGEPAPGASDSRTVE